MSYRDWSADRSSDPSEVAALVHAVPPDGTGTVFVNHCDDQWTAVWQDESPTNMDSVDGTKDEVLAWARSRPAARHLVFSSETEDYVALGMTDGG